MVRSDGGWTVTASSTSDVEVLGPTLENGRLRVTFRNQGQETLIVDVLGTDGRTLFVAAGPSYVIDLPRIQEPVILRARLMGGTVLGITELWVQPETGSHLTVAEGTWAGGNWTLVRSDTCAWVELDLGPIGDDLQLRAGARPHSPCSARWAGWTRTPSTSGSSGRTWSRCAPTWPTGRSSTTSRSRASPSFVVPDRRHDRHRPPRCRRPSSSTGSRPCPGDPSAVRSR